MNLPASNNRETIEAFEGLRGVAALGVVFIHTHYIDNFLTRQAYLFVDLFFLISGFLMARLYADALNSGADVREFILRRIGRLYPLFIASTVLYFVGRATQKAAASAGLELPLFASNGVGETAMAQATMIVSTGERILQLLTTVTMTHSLGFFDAPILNSPSWSISTEFYTYIVFALICLFAPARFRFPLFASLSVVGFVIAAEASVLRHHCLVDDGRDLCMNVHMDYGIFRCFGGFFAGALLSRLPAPRFTCGPSAWTGLLLPACVVLLFWFSEHHHWVALLVPAVLAMLVWSVSGDTGPFARVLQRGPFQFLGKVSYSVYLLHWPLMQFFDVFVPQRANPLVAAIFTATLLAISWVSFNRLEKPARDWVRRLARRFDGADQRLRSKVTSA